MSGTKGFMNREALKLQEKLNRLENINSNRTALLQITVAELISLFGEENINIEHPLFKAIQISADGVLIDIQQLNKDIQKFNAGTE